ncbi:MAG TPA: Trp family transcriptional regulator [Candidatus Paceibacterota bacterium]|nr:Trp family transcriptional regulator [Candidatus Paceibacterota bacterium]HPT18380.1 Trp family transcriptional regulator [Candidatus Paceibacterota bacterium]
MPHVSNKKLDKILLNKLFAKLISVLGKAQDKNYLHLVIKELFTYTEKIMLAKRLAIVLMLSKNLPQHRIAESLKVSPTTVTKISLRMENGKYDSIIKISKKEKVDLEKIIMNILTAGGIMPPMVGKKYWRKINK